MCNKWMLYVLKSRRKTWEPTEDNVTLGPAVRDGELVFGVVHIFASFNDTSIVSSSFMFLSFYPSIYHSLPNCEFTTASHVHMLFFLISHRALPIYLAVKHWSASLEIGNNG
ncbi:hypothetical protein DM860_011105 [Cuscuta australis]|uniref:Uncharacterized protein n=1 Tax=Cuscuta australis TaxID=267555 RepID=A0A328E580_9ASTE|nr:hypothetical protein DM860_011105 [Cuscuta australis]